LIELLNSLAQRPLLPIKLVKVIHHLNSIRLFSFSTMFFIDFISCPARTRLLFDFIPYFYRGGSRTLFLPRNLGTRFSQSLSPFYWGGSSLSMFITF
jgi:hypothetical protein